MPKTVPPPSDRSFGLTFVVVFAAIAIWQGWTSRIVVATSFAGLGLLFLAGTQSKALRTRYEERFKLD